MKNDEQVIFLRGHEIILSAEFNNLIILQRSKLFMNIDIYCRDFPNYFEVNNAYLVRRNDFAA
jgi:hypothetical protein